MVWWEFALGLRFGSYFHGFYECWMSHNIEGDVRLIKECCPLLVQILFFSWIQSLGQWNMSKGSSVVIYGFITTLCSICKGGWNFEPFPFATSKQILLPLKDLVFPWPHPLFAHSGYGLESPCCFMVEGQVHHIEQIVPSPMDVLLNMCYNFNSPIATISIAQMKEHSILLVRNNIVAKLAFHLPRLVLWHQIPWTGVSKIKWTTWLPCQNWNK